MSSRRFRVTVEGRTYEVEVEEVGAPGSRRAAEESGTTRHAPAEGGAGDGRAGGPESGPATAGPTPAAAGETPVAAPLPGVVLDMAVSEGDHVSAGQVVAVLEAMKMENEITAPVAGTVVSVSVEVGAAVDQGDAIVVIGAA